LHRLPYFLMKFGDLYVWLKCLVNEVVLRNRELQWLRADRNSPQLRIPRGTGESELRMATTYARVRNPFHNPF
jgi:intergrase/recombinase